jgi:branched-subunit amino acid aminotransferase/4-amino-4-deoxychorismate lyase
MGEYFFLNGKIIKAEDAYLQITDLALLRGFGIFDFCRTQNGRPLLLERYLARFYNSASFVELNIPYSKENIKDVIYTLLKKNDFKEAGIRMVLTGGYTENGYLPGKPNFFILIEKINFPDESLYANGIKLYFLEHQRELSHIKSINYLTPISIRNILKKEKAYDVLYHFNGNVLEVSRSNIFIIKDNRIITPIKNILPGITRSTVINLAKELYTVEEREIHVKEIFEAEEAFITGTTKKVLPVKEIDDHLIGTGKPGPVTRKLKALYSDFENSLSALATQEKHE